MATKFKFYCSTLRHVAFIACLISPTFLFGSLVSASVITFETLPSGGTPIDNQALLAPYVQGSLSIAFSFFNPTTSVTSNARFEEVGMGPGETPATGGFLGSSGPDTADPGFGPQLGHWFLRGPIGASDFGLMVINYSGLPITTAASGEIWDIDGNPPNGSIPGATEEYTVRAYDAANNLLATQVSPLGVLDTFNPLSLDGQPWTFSFSGLTVGIAKITIDFTGTKTAGIGLAFNNFNPTGPFVPEPASWLLVISGIASLSCSRRGRIRRSRCA